MTHAAGAIRTPQVVINTVRAMADRLEEGNRQEVERLIVNASQSWGRSSIGYQLLHKISRLYNGWPGTNPKLQRAIQAQRKMAHLDKVRSVALRQFADELFYVPGSAPIERISRDLFQEQFFELLPLEDFHSLASTSTTMRQLSSFDGLIGRVSLSWSRLANYFENSINPKQHFPNLRVITAKYNRSYNDDNSRKFQRLFEWTVRQYQNLEVVSIPDDFCVPQIHRIQGNLSRLSLRVITQIAPQVLNLLQRNPNLVSFTATWKSEGVANIIQSLSLNCRRLRRLKVQSDRGIAPALGHLSKLKELTHLKFDMCGINDYHLPSIAEIQHLREVDLFGNPIEGFGLRVLAEKCRSLTGIHLPQTCTDDALAGLSAANSRLRKLSIDGPLGGRLMSEHSLQSFALTCKKLQEVQLTFGRGFKSIETYLALSSSRKLRSIFLEWQLEGDDVIKALAKQSPKLQSFTSNSGCLTDHAAFALAKYCLRLQHLHLNFSNVSDAGMKALIRACPFVSLYLSMETYTDATLAAIGKYSSQLKSLSLLNARLTDAGIRHLLHCPTLEELGLYICRSLTDETLKILAEHPHRLKKLNMGTLKTISNIALLEQLAQNHPAMQIEIRFSGFDKEQLKQLASSYPNIEVDWDCCF